jgi:para-aminobenzoate synthetase component 1
VTSTLLLQELPYLQDSTGRFEPLADHAWAMWLDSAGFDTSLGRYDILVDDPLQTLVTRGMQTTITERDGSSCVSDADPFGLIRQALSPFYSENPTGLPFVGGALGYLSYDLARRIEQIPAHTNDDQQLPEMAVGIYEWACIADHHERRSWLVGLRSKHLESRWNKLVEKFLTPVANKPRPSFTALTTPVSETNEAAYAGAFARIHDYLRDGDCYQINYARRFTVSVEGDPFAGYCRLRKINSAPFSAYLNLPFAQIMSSSPERFMRIVDRKVETRPIKGTRARSADPNLDRQLAEELRTSSKDRAENVMIVDLLRNDLGKNCVAGSVHVPELFAVESYATVHHLVSTVKGTLREDRDALDLLRGAFPGGSITGAPKRRAMEIIEELEPYRRGIYCGAIGYIGFDGQMDTNIAIRTLVHRDGEVHFWAGGGIVIDSDMNSEFQETLHKAAGMLRLFES